jgi:ketosteroid isomerase-like protein
MARTFSRDELEQAFRTYWRTGAVGEDWDAWADLFTEDCLYVEHMYGTMHGREAVRAWIVPIMEKYRELYTGYEWHAIDDESGRVFLYVQNRRDHPSGRGTIDFPGITILVYAGDGKWKSEEDFWSAKEREVAMREYEAACREFDPDHPKKHTRFDWGQGAAWTKGGRTYADRPRVR